MRKTSMIVILFLIFTCNAAAAPNDCELVQINSTHWYFVTTQSNLEYGIYNYQAFANNISSDYRVVEYGSVSQPPQNLTFIPHQTSVDVDWDDMPNADKYSVYELVDGFAWSDTSPTIDGIKDSYYDNAHQFLIFAPNPVNPSDYEPIWAVHTVDGAYFYIESTDNDEKSGDDDTIFYISRNGVNLTVGDPAWKVTDNQLKKYLWDGANWAVTGVTDADAASTGGGTFYPKHELFIPIVELGGDWINESTVKVLVKREDSSLDPDVVKYYPHGNINNTDVSLWQSMKILTYEEYNWLANVTSSEYTATNLTPFTWYYGGVTAWNGTTESAMTTSAVITEDLPKYTASGTIFDEEGNPISNATVYSRNCIVGEATTTNASGYWIGTDFYNGTYTICVNAAGYDTNSTLITIAGVNLTNVNITLSSSKTGITEIITATVDALSAIVNFIVDIVPIIIIFSLISLVTGIFAAIIRLIRSGL